MQKAQFTILFFFLALAIHAQHLEGVFHGAKGDIVTTYEFFPNGEFKYSQYGGVDSVESKGRCALENDTLILLRTEGDSIIPFEEQKMLIENDSCIIEIKFRQDFCKNRSNTPGSFESFSETRAIKFPQTPAQTPAQVTDLIEVLTIAFTHPDVMQYYHFEQIPSRQFIFKSYYELNESFELPDSLARYNIQIKDNIKSDFYIGMYDINQNKNRIWIIFYIKGEGVKFNMVFDKENDEWSLIHWYSSEHR